MLDGRVRARAAAVCGALVLTLTACGSLGTGTGSPRSTGDLFSALPGTVSAIPAPPSASQDDKARSGRPHRSRAAVEAGDRGGLRLVPRRTPTGPTTASERSATACAARRAISVVRRRTSNITARDGRRLGRHGPQARTRPTAAGSSAPAPTTAAASARRSCCGPSRRSFPQTARSTSPRCRPRHVTGRTSCVHFPGPGGSDKVVRLHAEDDFSQWHTFAVDWLPDRIVYYVDGVERFRVTDRNIIPDKPMHLAMQFDQGPKKDWIPAPDATTPAAFSLQVDWLRVYAPSSQP